MAEEEKVEIDNELERLQEIVEEIEGESVSLDRSIELFKEGVRLADDIQQRLNNAEAELKEVIQDAEGNFSWEDLDI